MRGIPVINKSFYCLICIPALVIFLALTFPLTAQEEVKEDDMRLVSVQEKDLEKIKPPKNLIHIVKDKKFIGEGISFTFIETEKHDIIRSISKMIQQEITIDPKIRGKVTYRLQQVPWNKAIAIFLKDNNLELLFDGNTLKIQERRSPAPGINLYFWVLLIFLILVFLLIARKKFSQKGTKKSERKTLMEDPQADQYAKRVVYLMEVEKIFRDETLSLDTLAEKLDIKKYQLSWIINEKIKRTFSDLLNHYRIEEAKMEILNSPKSEKNILEIIYDTGFNTKTAFNRTFKRYTGLTPSQFKNKNQKG